MIFAPLAVDADPPQMRQVVERLRAETPAQAFAELAAALTVVATKGGRRRGLREVILGLLRKEDVMRSAVFELGKQDGRLEGKLEGEQKGEQKAVSRMFEKRLGRPLVEGERAVLLRRLGSLGADRLMDVRDELGPDALAAWLAAPDAA
jgi:predicted transposase YdaD